MMIFLAITITSSCSARRAGTTENEDLQNLMIILGMLTGGGYLVCGLHTMLHGDQFAPLGSGEKTADKPRSRLRCPRCDAATARNARFCHLCCLKLSNLPTQEKMTGRRRNKRTDTADNFQPHEARNLLDDCA